jgi:hypothetical protein
MLSALVDPDPDIVPDIAVANIFLMIERVIHID